MSKKGSEKEFIFSLGLKENIEILEKALGLELIEVKLEKSYEGVWKYFKVDMYALEKNYNVPVFVENVLTVSDDAHQERLLKVINHIDNGIIVYQALDFKKKHVEELRKAVKGKAINLYFVKINKGVIEICMLLNSKVHKLKVFYNLNMFNNIQNPLELLNELSIIKPLEGSIEAKIENIHDIEKYFNNNFLMGELRSKIPYFFSFQREKSNLDKNSTLKFGTGKADISLNISVNCKKWAFVELSFAKDSIRIYHMIKKEEERAKKIVGSELEFINKKHKIIYRFKPYTNIVKTVNRIVPIVEKYLQAFCNYTYYHDNIEMWGKFDNSL